jgi:hypothetical protein
MNARLNALATVLDVVVLVGLGLGLFFAPLTLVWAFDDGFATDLLLSWAIAVDGWMLGHGVPLTFTLDPLLAQSLSLGDTNSNFVVDVALLGVGLLTLLWGYRIGRRSGTRIYPVSTPACAKACPSSSRPVLSLTDTSARRGIIRSSVMVASFPSQNTVWPAPGAADASRRP